MQDHVLGPRQAFDFGDELTIGGRDAVSSSSAVVSDRLGSLSYHKPDHPTLNAAAALGPTSTPPTAVLLRGHRACRRRDLSADPATSPYYGTDGHKSRYREKGCYVRGRSSGKTGPPATTVSPRYAGGLLHCSYCISLLSLFFDILSPSCSRSFMFVFDARTVDALERSVYDGVPYTFNNARLHLCCKHGCKNKYYLRSVKD